MQNEKPIQDILKEKDAFLTFSERVYEYFLRHTRAIALAGAALVAIVIIVAVVITQREEAEMDAQVVLEKTLVTIDPSQPAQAIAALEKVRADLKDYKAGQLAGFFLLNLYATAQNYDKALTIAENLLQTNTEKSLRPLLLFNAAGLYETLKKYDLALATYETLATEPGLEAQLKQKALLALGRVNTAAENKEKAEQNYRLILAEFPNSDSALLANFKLAELLGEPVSFPGGQGVVSAVEPKEASVSQEEQVQEEQVQEIVE